MILQKIRGSVARLKLFKLPPSALLGLKNLRHGKSSIKQNETVNLYINEVPKTRLIVLLEDSIIYKHLANSNLFKFFAMSIF